MTVSSLQVLSKVEVIPWIFFKFTRTSAHFPFKPCCAPFCLPTMYMKGIICEIKVNSNGPVFELDKQNRFAKNSKCSKEKDPKNVLDLQIIL